MANVKKLLVPIDFSPESEKALKYSCALAKQINAEIIALHVLDELTHGDGLLPFIMPPEGWPFFGAEPPFRPIDVLLRERALDLWNFIDRNVCDARSVKVKRLVRLGTVREAIIAVAREESIDLVVLELRNRFIFPNLANRKLLRMIEKLPYPVLLAPPINEDTPRSGRRVPAFYHPVPSENPA
ncbi:MAG TPA: universal stress protein [Candidatus Binatia bacterium]|jgi:nucleotide-binding universal stress UspA family protein